MRMNGLPLGSIGGVPVHATGGFLLLAGYVVLRSAMSATNGAQAIIFTLSWVVAIALSIAVHEFGHAIVAKRLRLDPRIQLHAFGGLCFHERAERDAHDALILIAGPLAGFLLGGLAWGAQLVLDAVVPVGGASDSTIAGMTLIMSFLRSVVWVCLLWNAINLLPIWPMDGGRLARLGLIRVMRPAAAERLLHVTSIAMLLAGAGFWMGTFYLSPLLLILIGLLIWQNVQVLRGAASSGPMRAQNRHARALLTQAEEAFAAENFEEAARLCHQLRAESSLPPSVLDKCWRLLGLATFRGGRVKESLSYLKRAPLDTEVARAWADALAETEQWSALDELLSSREFARLPAGVRSEIEEQFPA